MSKSNTLFLSILLIISAVLIHLLKNNQIPENHFDLVGFFVGFTFIAGVGYSILPFIKRKNKG
jgi:4-hydroxybenzoate polyprenyltransferase